MNRKNFYYCFLALFVLVFPACEEELLLESEIVETTTVSLDREPVPDHIREKLEKLGFVVDDQTFVHSDGYVVEGDIGVPRRL